MTHVGRTVGLALEAMLAAGWGDESLGLGTDAGQVSMDGGATSVDGGVASDGGAAPAPVRFVVMGDTGEGNTAQHEVAAVIKQVCAERGCDFALLNGAKVKDFLEGHACGKIDIYFAGHDHNRQWINEPGALCGTEMIVSGAGAKTTGFESELNASHYQDDNREGFLHVVVEGRTLTDRFSDRAGNLNFTRTLTK